MKWISVGKTVEPYPMQMRFLLIRDGELKACRYDIPGLASALRRYLESGYRFIKNDVPDILCLDGKACECQRLSTAEVGQLVSLLNNK